MFNPAMLISEAFETYRTDYIVYNDQSKKTEEMHGLALKSLVNFIGDIDVKDLTFQHIRDWKDHLSRSKTQNTVRGYVLKLRVVVAYTRKRGQEIIDEEIIGIPKRKRTQVEFVKEDDVELLIRHAFAPKAGYLTIHRYRNRAIVSLLYASGVRVSELCRMDISHLNKELSFTVIGKGDKPRLCFYDQRTKGYIDEYLKLRNDNISALFLSEQTGKRISVATVQMIFQVARKKAGFNRPIHPHTMRHSFATNLLRNNTNLLYVSKFLGHASVQTTEMYTHVVDEDLRKIYLEKHTI